MAVKEELTTNTEERNKALKLAIEKIKRFW